MTQARIDRVVVHAPAKINLCLHVGTRRSDGYHDLESLVVFVETGDTLTLERAERLSLAITGPFAEALPVADDNLVLKAARLLAERMGCTAAAHILLTKRLPVASGIGGGSADAAATLRGLARLWQLDITTDELLEIAASLGADVPMCVASVAAWVEGRGERMSRVHGIPEIALVLANPMVAVSTAEVFAKLDRRTGVGRTQLPPIFNDVPAIVDFLRSTANDLQTPAVEIAPVIADVLKEMRRLPGVLFARMSGSGATCFGVFPDRQQAERAAADIQATHPGWWIAATGLASPELGKPSLKSPTS